MWKPLGEILVEQGLVTEEQLTYALEIQLDSSDVIMLGEVLVSMGVVSKEQVEAAIKSQEPD